MSSGTGRCSFSASVKSNSLYNSSDNGGSSLSSSSSPSSRELFRISLLKSCLQLLNTKMGHHRIILFFVVVIIRSTNVLGHPRWPLSFEHIMHLCDGTVPGTSTRYSTCNLYIVYIEIVTVLLAVSLPLV